MNIHRITYNPQKQSCSLYFIGCNFRCLCCYWKQIYPVRSKAPEATAQLLAGTSNRVYGKVDFRNLHFLHLEEVLGILRQVSPKNIYILSGDPRQNTEFTQLPKALYKEFGCTVRLLTNGYILPDLEGITHVSMSIKAIDDSLHIRYTGKSNKNSLENFRLIHKKGIELSTSSVYIPGLIEKKEIEDIAKFMANIDENIPYRVIGYMKVSGLEYKEPDYEEVREVASLANKYLKNITFSRPKGEDYTGIVDLFTNNLRV